MKRHLILCVALAALLAAGAFGRQGQSKSTRPGGETPSGSDPTGTILNDHKKLDVDGDGLLEIQDLALIDRTPVSLKTSADFVLVLVDPRLLTTSVDPADRSAGRPSASQDFLDGLDRFQNDLRADGFPNHLVKAQVYSGTSHQDGRTVIALRRLLRAFRDKFPAFKGVIFIGSFPEPMIARMWVWKKSAKGLTIGGKVCSEGTEFLRIVPEIVSERSDLVLADLTGNWEALYQKGPYSVTSIEAVPDQKLAADGPKAGKRITSSQFNRTTLAFNDVFFIDDTDLTFHSESPTLDFTVNATLKHPEMTAKNKTAANPIARPEIFVSRINARHIGLIVDPNLQGIAGRGLLDEGRKPQTVVFVNEHVESSFWKRDLAMERRLLIEYFDRNHKFRTDRPAGGSIQAAAIAYPLKDFSAADDAQWMKSQCPTMQVRTQENASLVEYINWLKGSGTILFIDAHSNSNNTEFGKSYGGPSALESALKGQIWRWQADGKTTVNGIQGYRYKPSWGGQDGNADFYISRSIYESGLLASAPPRIYIHKGCQANSPYYADQLAYDNPSYAVFQNAECVLFYLNGVAIVTRAKVFYDPPRDFIKGLTSPGGNIGKGWEAYFRSECNDAELAKDPADCKRSYTWSILGDWTLRAR